jgi:hypothetical protein
MTPFDRNPDPLRPVDTDDWYIEPYKPEPIDHWDWVLLAVVLGALAIFALRWGLFR